MNVLQFLIDHARSYAIAIESMQIELARKEGGANLSDEQMKALSRTVKELRAAADLAEHSLRALGLLAQPQRVDEE